jgi:hypothetical protein
LSNALFYRSGIFPHDTIGEVHRDEPFLQQPTVPFGRLGMTVDLDRVFPYYEIDLPAFDPLPVLEGNPIPFEDLRDDPFGLR